MLNLVKSQKRMRKWLKIHDWSLVWMRLAGTFSTPSISELPDFLSDAPVSDVLHCNSSTVHQRIAWFLVGRCFVLIAKILPVQTCKDLCVVQGTGVGKNASQLLKASCASYAKGLPLAAKVHWTVCLSLAMLALCQWWRKSKTTFTLSRKYGV